jgi:hypothetical protein
MARQQSQKQHFRLHNLAATIVPEEYVGCPRPTGGCGSGTCCGPPSALYAFDCFFSMLLPQVPQLTPDDLRTILRDMRSKLHVERRGLDIVLIAESDQVAGEWRQVLEDEGLEEVETLIK